MLETDLITETVEPVANLGDFIWAGSAGIVHRLPNGNALKTAHEYSRELREKVLRNIFIESSIYQRLPEHPRILRFIRYDQAQGIEFEYASGGTLKSYLEQNTSVDLLSRLQWAQDAAEGLSWLHKHNIIHCDVKSENFLLDGSLRLKIIDFEGSSLDGGYHSALESTRYCRPRDWDTQSTISTDLFALGSTIYEIITGQPPFVDLQDEEVEKRFSDLQFPDVTTLPCAEIMKRCWLGTISHAEDVLSMLDDERKSYQEHMQP